jgi:hypothetical protein
MGERLGYCVVQMRHQSTTNVDASWHLAVSMEYVTTCNSTERLYDFAWFDYSKPYRLQVDSQGVLTETVVFTWRGVTYEVTDVTWQQIELHVEYHRTTKDGEGVLRSAIHTMLRYETSMPHNKRAAFANAIATMAGEVDFEVRLQHMRIIRYAAPLTVSGNGSAGGGDAPCVKPSGGSSPLTHHKNKKGALIDENSPAGQTAITARQTHEDERGSTGAQKGARRANNRRPLPKGPRTGQDSKAKQPLAPSVQDQQ